MTTYDVQGYADQESFDRACRVWEEKQAADGMTTAERRAQWQYAYDHGKSHGLTDSEARRHAEEVMRPVTTTTEGA
jgi:hypothetical protein